MARTIFAQQTPTSAGIIPAYSTPDTVNNNMYANDPHTTMYVKNGSGAGLTISFVFPTTPDGVTITPSTVTVAAGAERWIKKDWVTYNQSATSADVGYTYVNFSASASISVAILHT